MIALRNLEKSYSHGVSKTFVLRQIDLDVKEGELLSIMGPSGAGKWSIRAVRTCGSADVQPEG